MRIAVAGAGYVGTSLAVLLATQHEVSLVDIDPRKIALLESGVSPVRDSDIETFLTEHTLNLHPTLNAADAYAAAEIVIVAVPTDYDSDRSYFDTSTVDAVLEQVAQANPNAYVVIKSTIPVGYTEKLAKQYPNAHVLFSPEFLREGKALYDNMHPSRIVVGIPRIRDKEPQLNKFAQQFAALLVECAGENDVPVLIAGSAEAEAIKLFANTYLALRVAYFNELDTYAATRGLDVGSIIEGVSLDPRIGNYYNNPSFGYGGYCLPKDTKQLLANYQDIPQSLVSAVVSANRIRKDFIADSILLRAQEFEYKHGRKPLVGVYRLAMKAESDNIRSSSVLGIMKRLVARNIPMLVYAPLLEASSIMGCTVTRDLDAFKQQADLIIANRYHNELADVEGKVYTRDLFNTD